MSGSSAGGILRCPFCDGILGGLENIKTDFGGSFEGGKCECGAVYVYDRSGHNLGDAYVDALTFACNNDWERAWSLVPDVDYEVKEVSYDKRRNRFSRAGRKPTPTFLFVLVKRAA